MTSSKRPMQTVRRLGEKACNGSGDGEMDRRTEGRHDFSRVLLRLLKGDILKDALLAGLIINRLHHIGITKQSWIISWRRANLNGSIGHSNRAFNWLTNCCILRRKNHREEGIKAHSRSAIVAKTAAIIINQIGSSIVPSIRLNCLN